MKLALVDSGILMTVKKLDGIFDGNDVVVLRFIDQIDNGRQG